MDRFRARREGLRRTLEASDAEGFLVASPTNVRYLTGFTGDSSVLLFGRDREIIVSDGRFTTQLDQECPGARGPDSADRRRADRRRSAAVVTVPGMAPAWPSRR